MSPSRATRDSACEFPRHSLDAEEKENECDPLIRRGNEEKILAEDN
jgi:hypothetical protein